jgi:hypothetical protein
MFIAGGLTDQEVITLLQGNGCTLAEATRLMLHAMLHGSYTSKRRNVVFDEGSGTFAVIIRR